MTELINTQSLKPVSTAGSVQNNNKKTYLKTNQYGHIRKQKMEKSLEMTVEKHIQTFPKEKYHTQLKSCFPVISLSSPENNSNHK